MGCRNKALLLDLTDSGTARGQAKGRAWPPTTNCVSHPALAGVLVRPDDSIARVREDGAVDGLDEAPRTWFAR